MACKGEPGRRRPGQLVQLKHPTTLLDGDELIVIRTVINVTGGL
jgi:hypothetical protein